MRDKLETYLNYSLERKEWEISPFENIPIVIINYKTRKFEFIKDLSKGRKREIKPPKRALREFWQSRRGRWW